MHTGHCQPPLCLHRMHDIITPPLPFFIGCSLRSIFVLCPSNNYPESHNDNESCRPSSGMHPSLWSQLASAHKQPFYGTNQVSWTMDALHVKGDGATYVM